MNFKENLIFLVIFHLLLIPIFLSKPDIKTQPKKQEEVHFEIKDIPRKYKVVESKNTWDEKQFECLSKNIYFEARNQPINGMIAVGNVVMNRVKSKRFPDTICGVVQEKNQFSWFNDGKSDTPRNKKIYEKSKIVAKYVILAHKFDDESDGSIFYHADYVNPKWSDSVYYVKKIGNHIFYK